jgi:NADPH2:quinone reductase
MAGTRRALVVREHGGVEVLQTQQEPVPDPGPGQLLVEVAAAGVNFVDVYRREGVYAGNPPFVLGGECAGRVIATGEDVTDFSVGDAVASAAVSAGSHTSHALVEASQAVPVPDGVDLEVAAAAMLQGMTAHYLVHSTYPVRAGDAVLVHAGAGGVGQLLIQMAKEHGARVIATAGSAPKVEVARRVGADEVIRYDQLSGSDELAGAVRQLVPDGVHAVYDGVGKATFDASLASLRVRGMLVLFGAASGQVPPFDLQRLNAGGSLFVTRPTLVHYTRTRAELLERAGDVLGSIADARLHIEIGGRYPLDQAAQAYRDLEGRKTTGKLLLVP